MKILVINAGSSSLKYQLIDMSNEEMVAKGNCERIGMDVGVFTHKTADGRSEKLEVRMSNHTEAFMQVKKALLDSKVGVIQDLSEVTAIGHRIVQGGSMFSRSVLVDEDVIEGIESLIPLAPLHNSAHVQGIRACRQVFGEEVPEVVVFDTAFKSYDERQQQKQRDNKQARFVLPDFLLHNELRSVQTKTGIVQDYPDFAQGCSVSSSAFTLYMGDDTR